jgi:hypothetical protein
MKQNRNSRHDDGKYAREKGGKDKKVDRSQQHAQRHAIETLLTRPESRATTT